MKSVVVTGGTCRLGLLIAERLRREGWRVITTSHRADAGADLVADLAKPGGAVRLFLDALALLGGGVPDALVSNAALFTGEADALREINFESPRRLTTLMAGRETGIGAVVNILDARERPGVYGETKRELAAWTLKAAGLFANTLRVNGVAPGPVLAPREVREKAGECPLGRPTGEDVAAAVAFLLSAKSTTGCIIPVDGGQSSVI